MLLMKSILVKRMRMRNLNSSTNKAGILLFDFIFALVLLAFDQFTKYLAIVRLKGSEPFVLIPGVLEFDYLENRGSAFGMLQNQKIFLLCVGVVFVSVICYFLFKIPAQKKYNWLHLLFTLIVAGGIGNMIDRFRFSFVVDFISFVLIHFPVFNVADCYVTISVIALLFMMLFKFSEDELNNIFSLKKKRKV